MLVDVLLTLSILMTSSNTFSNSRQNASIKHVLYSEILSVTSAMRKNSRWASSPLYMSAKETSGLGSNLGLRISSPANTVKLSARGGREAELMGNFQELKRMVKDISGDYRLDPSMKDAC